VIPALVLTAGLATRLRPLSLVRAKAALPVAGQPLITRILRALRAAGGTEAVLNLHHLPHTLTRIMGDGSDLGVRVRYSWENPVLGSAGGPRQALPLLGASTFLIVNGDTLADVDIGALVAAHQRSGALVTMAVVPNADQQKYSGVAASDDGAFTGLVKRGSLEPSYHFVGVQVAEAEAFASLAPGTAHESVAAVYPALIGARPDSIRVHVCNAEFFDIGTPDDYLSTSLRLSRREGTGTAHGRGTRIHPTARIEESVLWDDVEVGAGTMLRQCIVTDGVRVPEDTSWVGVTLRRPDGQLAPGERRIEDLAIASL
jgi:mannose-1-phosphate guanylyltransferase